MGATLKRRVAAFGSLVLAAAALAGCSPANIAGVELSDSGMPVLVNCGSWYDRIEAYDADSGQLVWSAESSTGDGAEVEVGVLPGDDWTELSPLQPSDTLTEWRFVLKTTSDEPHEALVDRADVTAGRVFLFNSGESVSADHFRNETCGAGIPGEGWLRAGLSVVAVTGMAIVAVVAYANRSRRRAADLSTDTAGLGAPVPPGWYAVNETSNELRWWDGNEWTEHLAERSDRPSLP